MPGNHQDLFHQSDPGDVLDYLQKRLSAHDLSPAETLAMIGSVHEALSSAKADRRTYQKYSEFMEALRLQMPEVYAQVVRVWLSRTAGGEASEPMESLEPDSVKTPASGEVSARVGGQTPVDEMQVEEHEELEGGESEEQADQSESDEKADLQAEDKSEAADQAEEENDEAEPEEKELAEPEDNEEEPEEKEPEPADEETEEPEAEEEQAESEPEAEESDSTESEPQESESGEEEGGDAPEQEGAEDGKESESEWPEMEESSPEEPVEGEEGNTPAID